MTTRDENREAERREGFDPFPKPNTIPSGWDTSELFTAPQPDADTEAEPSAEDADD